MSTFIDARRAAELIQDGDTVAISGFGGYGSPEEMILAIKERFLESRHPRNIKLVKGVSIGDYVSRGTAQLFENEGLVGTLFTSHVGLEPSTYRMVAENRTQAYFVPLGTVCHLLRAIAGKKPGILTRTGLFTYADPRLEGGKANEVTRKNGEDIVQLVQLNGEDCLFYPSFPIHVSIIRGTAADKYGNISFRGEPILSNCFEMAAAAHNSGGIVIAQVSRIEEDAEFYAKDVLVPGKIVDYVVLASPENSEQCFGQPYRADITGESFSKLPEAEPIPLDLRKVCARRAALELVPGDLINLGIGMPDAVSSVISEEGMSGQFIFSIEAGSMGGVPLTKVGFGASANPRSILSLASTFDLYDGGALNCTVLGAAEIDRFGNVNVSSFNGRCVGPGGFVNISQFAQKVCFIGSFTAGKTLCTVGDGKLKIDASGKIIKFKNKVEQVTFSAAYAVKNRQTVKYITERAVFELTEDGIVLTEIAPGLDLKSDILPYMEFVPQISSELRLMDDRIFRDALMGLAGAAHGKKAK